MTSINNISARLGSIAVVIAVLAIVIAIALPFSGLLSSNAMRTEVSMPAVAPMKYNSADLQRFKNYEGDLQRAIEAKRELLDGESLKIFGYMEGEILAQVDQASVAHVLSMVYESQGHRYAVINNRLYQPGNRLPDGTLVKEVNMGGAVVVNAGVATVLTLDKSISGPINVPTEKSRSSQAENYQEQDSAVRAVRQMHDIQKSLQVLQSTQGG